MTTPDDWDDPGLGRSSAAREPSLWASVRWRWRFGLVLCVLTGGLLFAISCDYYPWPDAARVAAVVAGMIGVLWFGSRVLWAWLEWPTDSRALRGLKATLRFFLFDAAAERRDSPDRAPPRTDPDHRSAG